MTSYISNDLMNTITKNYITIECSGYHKSDEGSISTIGIEEGQHDSIPPSD